MTAFILLTLMVGCGKKVDVALSESNVSLAPEGATVEVSLTSNGDWSVDTHPEWLSVSPASGKGDATLSLTAPAYEGEEARSGEVRVTTKDNSATLTVTQEPLPVVITYYITVNPTDLQADSEGGTYEVTVSSNDEWTVSTTAEWVHCEPASGNGDATVTLTVDPNQGDVSERGAEVTFLTLSDESASLQIVQEGSIPEPHFLVVSPTGFGFAKEGGNAEVTISCDTDWTVDLECEWASLSANSGTGNGTLTLTVDPNPIGMPRSIEFKVISEPLSQVITVSQEAGDEPLVVTFEPDTLFPTYEGGFQHLDLFSNTSWQLETTSGWITLLTTSGYGDASFNIVVDGNNNPEGRTGYINARHNGQLLGTIVVAQEGKPDTFETDITEISAGTEGGEFTIHLTSYQSWTLNCGEDWITCRPDSGLGSSDILVVVQPSGSPRPRTGHIKIVGSTGAAIVVTVEQNN